MTRISLVVSHTLQEDLALNRRSIYSLYHTRHLTECDPLL
jgi:hypothetical protein